MRFKSVLGSGLHRKIMRYIRHYKKAAFPSSGPTRTLIEESDKSFTLICYTALS